MNGVKKAPIPRRALSTERFSSAAATVTTGSPGGYSGRKPSSPHRRQINGYEVTNELGRGGFSIVYRCMKQGKVMAMKAVPKTNIGDEKTQQRFQREIDTMTYLNHPNIIKLYDFFTDESNFYLVMDLCSGGELKNYIIKNEKLPEPTAALIFQQVCQAIAYCHASGVAHRDLKPENILIDKFPNVKVSDFGLCGYLQDNRLMDTFCGSPCYCSPECLFITSYDGAKSDIWSLGVILYTMVTGNHPWDCTNQAVMVNQIRHASFPMPDFLSSECKELIASMIKANPDDRASMETILMSPWFKCAQKAQILQRDGLKLRPPQMPGSQEKVEEITKRIRRQSLKALDKTGLFSPFSGSGSGGLSRTYTRSLSFECFQRDDKGGREHGLPPQPKQNFNKTLPSRRQPFQ
ncbi:CAMK family protein kinase [Tritrichomonas foetus]|uniref:CAMK family protein kinase n=1 Tax=Tritrichomonas foetus TaxID=1144522 RepID=A0A1J4KLP7_9EUKA|nr:CAMK family protein kinase [Tritrichomonas foetus]|eukprot:OHT12139.1 CAMK family protein kinase [Tritrichomonas foetus]